MADFSSLVTDVCSITKRPDLVADTELAVKSATLKAHHIDFFYKDLFESGVSLQEAKYVITLEVKRLVPQYRALKYIRKSDSSGAQDGKLLTILTPEAVVDGYAINKTDIVYGAGNSLEIKSSTELQYFFLGCYVNPIVTAAEYNSWVADEYPFAIIYEAARLVYKQIGFDEQAAQFDALAKEEFALLRLSNILVNGY